MKQHSHKSLQEFVRYILVGGFNTVFGYGLFALLNWSFRGLGSYNYMYAALLANLIATSVAFLGYKWFVFRTRGNYMVEWLRCSARTHKVLCSNLGIISYGMTLDKSLTAVLSRITRPIAC